DCGALPTPALALAAMAAGAPSIMVTGSHIPDDRNGLKFYRAEGEIVKADEARINEWHARLAIQAVTRTHAAMRTPEQDPLAAYKARYTDFFGPALLNGVTVGVYQHSSVARDVIADVLGAMGARVIPFGRAERFIPVDTEAVRDEDRALAADFARATRVDAIVSTDGDADRPLIADGEGQFLRGDLVGAMTARLLGVTTLVTPVTSNSQLEKNFRHVTRTKVGSPFVIAGVDDQRAAGHGPVIGFEANGGVLLGDDVSHNGRVLPRLLTRDAMLPIICVLAAIATARMPLKDIAAGFRFAHADSTRVEHVPQDRSAAFLHRLSADVDFRRTFFSDAGGVAALDETDGMRFTLGNGETVHFRPSGNAPELRVYVEAIT
ncbi:MAG: phosphomannomutase, partial [Beijerinckiaceae bacterium]